ncbi:MAG: hypothetical protein HOV92_33885 [Streptomyces sp.]|nr:hypothetical protein [Streptomyces sp.]
MAWLLAAWSQVWPNLVASVIWATPTFVTHHLLVRRHLRRIHEAVGKGEES